MNIIKKIYSGLIFVALLLPSMAFAEKVLDKVEVVQAKTETEIHIEFLTQVRYVRHFPNNKETSRVQIFLEFPQLSTLSTQREFLNSPRTDLVPSFTVNYPDQKTNSIGVRFKKPIKFSISPDNSGRGIVIHVPNGGAVVSAAPIIDTAPQVETQAEVPAQVATPSAPLSELPAKPEGMADSDYAGKLVTESKSARGRGDYPKALQLLNAALNLPANSHSQEAQELIGSTREKMGESAKAKSEYETYLKLYPNGEGADRVRQRLAIIDKSSKVGVVGAQKSKSPVREIHENSVFGSWDQYYYDAHSHNYPGTGINTGSHDQSSLVSAINLTARFRQNEWDNKIVFRNTQTMNFLPKGEDRDRTQAAYIEINNKESDFLARLGRQNGNSGGVLGRFDGGLFRYGISPKLKFNFVAGTLDEYKVDYRRHFYGINLDIGPVYENWSGNVYAIEQTVDRLVDRRAVGAEVRYSKEGRSIYSLLDYDIYYSKVNTVMVQGNWLTTDGTNYNVLYDHRKSPVLQLINGLTDPAFTNQTFYPTTPTSIRQALQMSQASGSGLTVDDLRSYAINQALDTNLVLLGVTKQFTPRWQFGGDIQVSRVSGQPGASAGAIKLAEKVAADNNTVLSALERQNLENSFAAGNTYTYHVQAVGQDTLFKDDTSVISASITSGPTTLVQALVMSNVMVPYEKWRLDSSLKFLKIDSDPSSVQYIFSPTMRASYHLREKATIEAEVGVELTNENDFTNGHTRTFRDFSFIGYRLDI